MRESSREYNRPKRETHVLRIPQTKQITLFKEKVKSKKITDTKYPVNLGYYEKTKLKNSVEMEKNSSSKVQKIFSTKSEKKFPNLKKDIHIKIQKSYRIPNILDKQRKSPTT